MPQSPQFVFPDAAPDRPSRKYPTLQFVASVYWLLAVLYSAAVGMGAFTPLIASFRLSQEAKSLAPVAVGLAYSVGVVLVGGLVSLSLFAMSGAIRWMVGIEHVQRQIRDRSTK